MLRLTAAKADVGKRLDLLLVEKLGISRTKIQKLIKEGYVTLNGKLPTAHVSIEGKDKIVVSEMPEEAASAQPLPQLDIIYKDADVIVVNKPAGLLVHEAREGSREPTLCDAVVAAYPEVKGVGEDPRRPGIVHRLDKLVSGVMVVARTPEAYIHLKEQFKSRAAHKEYVALVYGRIAKHADTIRLKLARSKTKGRMVARPEEAEGKEAITHFEVLERFKTTTLLRVRIETGRTHQIRTHFLAIDHPVVGDPLYRKKRMKNIHPIELNRVFLHAAKLTLELPSGQTRTFGAPLPPELGAILKTLPKASL